MILIDGHVHLRRCFDPQAFLEAAYANVNRAARRHGATDGFDGVLCLTDAPGEDGYERLQALAGPSGAVAGPWHGQATGENVSLWLIAPAGAATGARIEAGRTLLVIAGRHIVTAERLEVLALGTRQRIEDAQPLAATLRTVLRCGALPVVPWGFGKWTGRRGRVLRGLLADETAPLFWLGDTANRLHRWPAPAPLRRAMGKGRPVLPGSDPLSWPSEQNRAGVVGARYPGRLDPEAPATDLLSQIRAHPERLQPYGRGESLRRFVVNQVASQVAKVRGRATGAGSPPG